jgi:hypothetical protein
LTWRQIRQYTDEKLRMRESYARADKFDRERRVDFDRQSLHSEVERFLKEREGAAMKLAARAHLLRSRVVPSEARP